MELDINLVTQQNFAGSDGRVRSGRGGLESKDAGLGDAVGEAEVLDHLACGGNTREISKLLTVCKATRNPNTIAKV